MANMKNRSHAHKGRLRITIRCPACGAPCIAKNSKSITNLTRQYSSLQCTNDLCGWTGAGTFEITNTISPPSKQFNRPTLPPSADDALLDSLQASDSLI